MSIGPLDQLSARLNRLEKFFPEEMGDDGRRVNMVPWPVLQSVLDERTEAYAAIRIALRLAKKIVDADRDESGRKLAQRIVNVLDAVISIPK